MGIDNNHIRIMMLSYTYIPIYSGPSKQAHQINKLLVLRKNLITVIAGNKNNESAKIDDIEVIRLPGLSLGKNFYSNFGLMLWTLYAAIYLIKHRNQYDIIHSLDSFINSAVFALIGRLLEKPVIVKSSIGGGPLVVKHFYQKLKINILRKNAHMVAISKQTLDELLSNFFMRSNVTFIPNGVDVQKYRPAYPEEKLAFRKEIGMTEKNFIGIYVGELIEKKGVDLLVKSWKKVCQKHNYCQLILVGPFNDAQFKKWLNKFISDNNLSNSIRIIGEINNVNEYLRMADCFIFLSNREGLPNALMEAMATGLPCIARPIGGVVDLIDTGNNGIICSGQDDELENRIVECIEKLIINPALRMILGANARDKMEKEYSIKFVSEKYQDLYQKLMGRNY